MLSVCYRQFFASQSHVILPYSEALATLPMHLQQLVMESNGKTTSIDGKPITYPTSGIIWGQKCSSGQHSFFQYLYQGSQFFSADFILPITETPKYKEIQDLKIANCLAQSQALLKGQTSTDAYRNIPGNRPSNLIILDELSPENIGTLLALYEHKTFVEATIWQINPFDQWGVELGKAISNKYFDHLQKQTNKVGEILSGLPVE